MAEKTPKKRAPRKPKAASSTPAEPATEATARQVGAELDAEEAGRAPTLPAPPLPPSDPDPYRIAGTLADHAASACDGTPSPILADVLYCPACVKHWTAAPRRA